MTTDDPIASLRDKFDISDDRDIASEMVGGKFTPAWLVECRHCSARYRLTQKADGTVHVGNILALLNHAASHESKKRRRA
jgi:hypothetical protein